MKNVFKKAVSLTVALSTVAALSVSAFAEEAALATYNENAIAVEVDVEAAGFATENVGDDGKVTYTSNLEDGQYAVAVVPFGFTGTGDNADADIFYVNQADQDAIINILTSMLVKGELNTEVDYEVRIGNNAGVIIDNIPVTFETTPEGVQITLNYGDVNGDGEAGAGDASLILQKYVGTITGFTDSESREIPETVGDVNGDGEAGAGDASLILQKYVGTITGFTDSEGNALTTYTYTYVAPTE